MRDEITEKVTPVLESKSKSFTHLLSVTFVQMQGQKGAEKYNQEEVFICTSSHFDSYYLLIIWLSDFILLSLCVLESSVG